MIRKEEAPTEETIVAENTSDSREVKNISPEKIQQITTQATEDQTNKEGQIENKEDHASNAYKLASANFRNIDEFTFSDIYDWEFVFFSHYTLIILVSVITFISALRKRIKTVSLLSVINLILAISSLLMFVCMPLFEEISQIKFGYYLFIINTIALIIFSKKSKTPDAV